MMKGEIRLESASNQLVIIDAYIIDELNEKKSELYDEGAPAWLPCPGYEAEMDKPAEEDSNQRVIIIEL